MAWLEFGAAFLAFFVLHSVPVRPPVRPWLVARLGERGFGMAYSVLSLVMLGLLFAATARAPVVTLWPAPGSSVWIVLAAMIAAALILGFGLFRPNPLSFAGLNNAAFDPDRPGLLRHLRHPVLAAFLLWALAHLVVNGDLAHVVLFGSFALFSLVGMKMIDRRKQREMGVEVWRRTVARMRAAPWQSPDAPLRRVALALLGVLVLILLHPWLAGVGVAWRFLP